MTPALIVPEAVVGMFALVGAVAVAASKRNNASDARREASVLADRAELDRQIQAGRDVADTTTSPLELAQACTETLHNHLAYMNAPFADVSWANHLCSRIGNTPTRDHADPRWLGLPFGIDAPLATITACLVASGCRARRDLIDAGDREAASRITTVLELLDGHLLYQRPELRPVRDQLSVDSIGHNARTVALRRTAA